LLRQSAKKSSAGKLAGFFGVGLAEVENAALKRALDELEPSGTFFELPGSFVPKDSEDTAVTHLPFLH